MDNRMKKSVCVKMSILSAALLMSNAALAASPPVPVSEPGTFALLACAVAALAFVRGKK
ncbi:MAG: hypothetical protein ACJA0N_002179 [Pseudohongiellaceae bacterium]|jgi:hypothetical protein